MGSRPFQFQWFKNGQLLTANDSDYKIVELEDETQLIIDKVDGNDSGNYSCTVRNSFGFDRQTTLLIVKG